MITSTLYLFGVVILPVFIRVATDYASNGVDSDDLFVVMLSATMMFLTIFGWLYCGVGAVTSIVKLIQ